MFGVNEVLRRAELVSSVGRSKSDRFARAKLWLFGLNEGSTRRVMSPHRGITTVR